MDNFVYVHWRFCNIVLREVDVHARWRVLSTSAAALLFNPDEPANAKQLAPSEPRD
jgi:hypothetical protein